MLIKSIIFAIIIFISIIICIIKRDNPSSILLVLATNFLITFLGNFFVPDITLYDAMDYVKERYINAKEIDANKETDKEEVSGKNKNVTPSPKHKHEKNQTVKENINMSQCNKKGSYDSVVYCVCGQELQRKTISTKELKHKYKKGVCVRCKHKDPDYIPVYNSKEIMKILSKSVVSSNEAYTEYLGSDTVSVFAKERHNCFSLNTLVSYNLWGYNVQTVVFNSSKIRKIGKLKFKIGGETGCSGSMQVEIFINKTFDKKPDYTYEMDASAIPTSASVNVKKAKSLGIRVTNKSGNENRMVFFGFSK